MSVSRDELLAEFVTPDGKLDEESLFAYADSFLNTLVAAQIKALREQRGLSQEGLAQLIGTKQSGISRVENVNYSAWKTETLRKIARALKVRLKISFETFGTLLDDAERFNQASLRRLEPKDDPCLARNVSPPIHRLSTGTAGQSGKAKLSLVPERRQVNHSFGLAGVEPLKRLVAAGTGR